jgi:hypothetical protein
MRKRGGKFISNAIQPLPGGAEVNLRTKDALEADRRAAAATAAYARGVRGQKLLEKSWSATAAATATVKALRTPAPAKGGLSPVPSPLPSDDEPTKPNKVVTPPAPAPVDPDMDDDEADDEEAEPAPAAAPAPEPLHVAAAAAAAETTGAPPPAPAPQVLSPKEARDARARDEIAKCLAELGAEGESLGEVLFDGVAAFALWAEGHAIAAGINWRLRKVGRPLLEPAPGDEKALARRLLRIGIKAEAIEAFPWLLDALTPKWAIVLGLALGAKNAAENMQPKGTIAAQQAAAAARANGVRPRPASEPAPAESPASEPQPASA